MSIASRIRRLTGRAPTAGGPVRAVWNGTVVAESSDTVVVEGNHYFPPDAVRREHLEPSDRRSICPWKGTASYYDLVADGERIPAAAWYYRDPKPAARAVKERVAFSNGVRIEPVG